MSLSINFLKSLNTILLLQDRNIEKHLSILLAPFWVTNIVEIKFRCKKAYDTREKIKGSDLSQIYSNLFEFRREKADPAIFTRNVAPPRREFATMYVLVSENIKLSSLGWHGDASGHVNGNECFSSGYSLCQPSVEWFVLLLVFEDRVRSECAVYQVTMKAALSSSWMHFRDFFSSSFRFWFGDKKAFHRDHRPF